MTGEEGPGRQKKRINRLGEQLSNPNNIDYFTPNKAGYCYVESIINIHKIHNHDYIFIDSLQELSSKNVKGEYKTIYGAVNILYNYLQNNSQLTIILIIQCTKAGKYAGSNKIKHKLDTMVFIDVFMSKIDNSIIGRKIRYSKNRDGEIGKPYDITLSSGGLSDYKPYIVTSREETPRSIILTAGLIGTANTSKIKAYFQAF